MKFRAGSTLHCRLGGNDYGDGYITGTQENISVMQMVLGNSAPQPPPPGLRAVRSRLRDRQRNL